MLSEATLDVALIAEDFLKNLPERDNPVRREVISAAKNDPNDKSIAFRLFNMTTCFFEQFPYAELEGDDEKMTRLLKFLLQ
jgi:hypothetical protein